MEDPTIFVVLFAVPSIIFVVVLIAVMMRSLGRGPYRKSSGDGASEWFGILGGSDGADSSHQHGSHHGSSHHDSSHHGDFGGGHHGGFDGGGHGGGGHH